MDNEELYDDIQEIKTALVITSLVAVYCFSMVIWFFSAHIEWKIICSSIGFVIVSAVDATLFLQLIRLKKKYKNIPENSKWILQIAFMIKGRFKKLAFYLLRNLLIIWNWKFWFFANIPRAWLVFCRYILQKPIPQVMKKIYGSVSFLCEKQ